MLRTPAGVRAQSAGSIRNTAPSELKAVDKAVATHTSTLALVPLDSLFEGGLIAALRARGYEIKLPQ